VSLVPELLRRRRTIRRLQPDGVPSDLIVALIEAAHAAPSAHGSRPWQLVVVQSEAARRTLALKMAEAFRRDLLEDGLPTASVEERVNASIARLTGAPVLIVACLDPGVLQAYPDPKRRHAELIMGAQSVAAAVQNLLLTASHLGLGAGWMCAPLFCQEVVREVLELADDWQPQALVTVGWPAEAAQLRAADQAERGALYR
jgi:coenzyme F420-0:L-glutamate ligase / coenzyme F420-1:gamma-L-glutamate ligase